MKKRMLRVFPICIALCVLLLGGCSSLFGQRQADDAIKVAYICKDLGSRWFIKVSEGLSKKCLELGMEYKAYNADFNDEKCLAAVRDAIAWGADAMAICTTNQKLGAQISRLCRNAAIPLITIDDTMADDEGNPLPHVGMPTYEIGVLGGTALSRLALERGFFDSAGKVKILQIDVPTLSVIRERLDGYNDALMMTLPLKEEDITVVQSPNGMYEDNVKALRAAELPGGSGLRWIVTGVNDDTALACIDVLRERGYTAKDILACGLGGYTIKEFKEGNRNYITIATQPHLEGEKAVELLYNHIENGQDLSDLTVVGGKVVTIDNYMMLIADEDAANTH